MLLSRLSELLSTKEMIYIDLDNDNTIEFIQALEYSLVKYSPLSVPFWADKIGTIQLNKILYVLGLHNLVSTKVNRKYASISATTTLADMIDDTLDYRINAKISKYGMKCSTTDSAISLTKTPSGIKDTGLIRRGFAYSSTQKFKLDIPMLVKYREAIILNAVKSIEKTMLDYSDIALDEANYRELVEIVIDNYIANPHNSYNLEFNINDQRGRSIYNGIKRVFNIISSKDSRALIIAPSIYLTEDNVEAMKDIYLFIAELSGKKRDTIAKKQLAGRLAYVNRELPVLDLNTEHDRKELFELIWLERIYTLLDTLKANGSVQWNVPLEVDAGMSLAQVIGATINSEELLVKTNCVGSKLEDPWHIDGVRRIAGKTVGTPTFYGSSQSAISLLKSKKLDPTKEELSAITREFNNGTFSIIKDFKNLLIKNGNVTTPTYEVQGWNESYIVEVNKHKAVGATLKAYAIWDTTANKDRMFFNHQPTLIPDYIRFNLFFPTGFVHNIESKIVDTTMVDLKDEGEWAISIHDAILCLPGSKARKFYIINLEAFNKVGLQVLKGYLQSIGATSTKAHIDLAKILDKRTVNTKKFSLNALK